MSKRKSGRIILFLLLVHILSGCQGGTDPPAPPVPPDSTPPAPIIDLTTEQASPTTITLTWTAPGDDGQIGRADEYDIRYYRAPITAGNWAAATRVLDEPRPAAGGTPQAYMVHSLDHNSRYYFAIRTADGVPNWSDLSNIASDSTLSRQDSIPPAAIFDLELIGSNSASLIVAWTATGDDSTVGTAFAYDMRYATFPINENTWPFAKEAVGVPAPKPPGSAESFEINYLIKGATYWIGIKARDEEPNQWSPLSNVVMAKVPDGSVVLQQQSTYDTPGYALALAMDSNLVFIADYDSGLHIIDVSQPLHPIRIGAVSLPGKAVDIALGGNYAYLAIGDSGLIIIDISDPGAPLITGRVNLPGMVTGVHLSKTYLYLTDSWYGRLAAVDLSDPAMPELIGNLETADGLFDLAVWRNYLFAAAGFSGVWVYNVTYPQAPSLVIVCDYAKPVRAIIADDRYIYLAAENNGICIADVSNPAICNPIACYDTPGQALNMAINDKYLFVADGWYGGLQMLAIDDIDRPKLAGSYFTEDVAHDLDVSGNLIFIANGESGLLILKYIELVP